MRAFLVVVALALVPSSLPAASISYEESFHVTADNEFLPVDDSLTPGLRSKHFLAMVGGWDFPDFDPTLGTAQMLIITIDATHTIAGHLTFGELGLIAAWREPTGTLNPFVNGGSESCDEPCDVFFQNHVIGEWIVDPQTHALDLSLATDSWADYEIAATGAFHIDFSGVAHAIYVYEPAATAIPEPTTLLLLGSALAGAAWKRRRRSMT